MLATSLRCSHFTHLFHFPLPPHTPILSTLEEWVKSSKVKWKGCVCVWGYDGCYVSTLAAHFWKNNHSGCNVMSIDLTFERFGLHIEEGGWIFLWKNVVSMIFTEHKSQPPTTKAKECFGSHGTGVRSIDHSYVLIFLWGRPSLLLKFHKTCKLRVQAFIHLYCILTRWNDGTLRSSKDKWKGCVAKRGVMYHIVRLWVP